MSIFKSFRNLHPHTRMLVGASFFTWGCLGLYISHQAEVQYGLIASEREREEWEKAVPRLQVVEREGTWGE